MRCVCCDKEMIRRDGKFGEFFYCKDHGTLSNQGGRIVATGAIKERIKHSSKSLQLQHVGNSYKDGLPIMVEIERQMLGFGIRMTDIDRFIEGETMELMQLNASDDEDHWLNTRPY